MSQIRDFVTTEKYKCNLDKLRSLGHALWVELGAVGWATLHQPNIQP